MGRESIADLLKYGERISLECKKAESTLPKSVWETYSSFANTVGGTILLGIEEDIKAKNFLERFHIGEIKNPNQLIIDFWNTVNSEKVSANILVDANVSIEEYQGKNIIRIDVPQASYHQRPVYIAYAAPTVQPDRRRWCIVTAGMVHGDRRCGAPGRHAENYSGMPLRLRMDSPSIWMV